MNLDLMLAAALGRVYGRIDAAAMKAHRLIRALAERDRRAIGQLTRFDHIKRRILK